MSTTTVFKGDIQFKVGEEEIKCSELATIDQVNTALEEIGSEYILKEPKASTTTQTINSPVSIDYSLSSSGFLNLFRVLEPKIEENNYVDLCVGKSTAADECAYLYYKEKGGGGLGVSGTPHVINFDKSSITLHKPTTIHGNLEVSGTINSKNTQIHQYDKTAIDETVGNDLVNWLHGTIKKDTGIVFANPGNKTYSYVMFQTLVNSGFILKNDGNDKLYFKPYGPIANETHYSSNWYQLSKITDHYTKLESDNKFASTAWVNNKISAITPSETISNSMLIIQRKEWMDYFYEPEQVPAGYEYQGCKTDWFPIIDYNASTMTDMLTQFKLDNTHTHQKYTNGTSGWLLRVKFIIVHVPYSTAHLTTSPAACFQPGNKGIDEMGLPFKYWLKSNISSYLWDTKHCTYSDGGKLTSNPCTVEFEYNGTETSMNIMMSGRASSTRGFQHDTFEMCFNIPTDQLNMIRIAMGWWYNGNGRTNYTCPPIRYLFKRNT